MPAALRRWLFAAWLAPLFAAFLAWFGRRALKGDGL
jgi:hypothetical protein